MNYIILILIEASKNADNRPQTLRNQTIYKKIAQTS